MRHVVVAMNRMLGHSFIKHHGLSHEDTIVVTSVEDAQKLAGLDVHDLAIHFSGDLRSINHDTELVREILWLTTHH